MILKRSIALSCAYLVAAALLPASAVASPTASDFRVESVQLSEAVHRVRVRWSFSGPLLRHRCTLKGTIRVLTRSRSGTTALKDVKLLGGQPHIVRPKQIFSDRLKIDTNLEIVDVYALKLSYDCGFAGGAELPIYPIGKPAGKDDAASPASPASPAGPAGPATKKTSKPKQASKPKQTTRPKKATRTTKPKKATGALDRLRQARRNKRKKFFIRTVRPYPGIRTVLVRWGYNGPDLDHKCRISAIGRVSVRTGAGTSRLTELPLRGGKTWSLSGGASKSDVFKIPGKTDIDKVHGVKLSYDCGTEGRGSMPFHRARQRSSTGR